MKTRFRPHAEDDAVSAGPSRPTGRRPRGTRFCLIRNIFSLKCVAFQTLRPVALRKIRFSARFGPGGAVPPPRVPPFCKGKMIYRQKNESLDTKEQ